MTTHNTRAHKQLVARISMSFNEAVRRAGPWTKYISPEEKAAARERGEIRVDSLIWQAGQLYRDIHNPAIGEVTLTLLNFGLGSRTAGHTAVLAAQKTGLQPASPYEVFALGIQQPTLYRELGTEPAGILSTVSRVFDGVERVCCVWLGSNQKECAFVPFDYPLHDGYWFAFAESDA